MENVHSLQHSFLPLVLLRLICRANNIVETEHVMIVVEESIRAAEKTTIQGATQILLPAPGKAIEVHTAPVSSAQWLRFGLQR